MIVMLKTTVCKTASNVRWTQESKIVVCMTLQMSEATSVNYVTVIMFLKEYQTLKILKMMVEDGVNPLIYSVTLKPANLINMLLLMNGLNATNVINFWINLLKILMKLMHWILILSFAIIWKSQEMVELHQL